MSRPEKMAVFLDVAPCSLEEADQLQFEDKIKIK
jgi:hypothetical protein